MNIVPKAETLPPEALPVSSPTTILDVIERAARDPAVDIEKLERLMSLKERMDDRAADQAYSEAMEACQAEMRPISQDMSNTQTKSKYASFGALDKAIRPIYTKHGFSVSFTTGKPDLPDHVKVIAKVRHKLGHSELHELELPADGKGAKGGDVMTKTHATMSAVSYGRRGLHKMIWNLSEGEYDDDGNGAGNTPITEEQVQVLADLIAETKANLKKFLDYFRVSAIYEIPANKFADAKRILEERKGSK